MLLGINYYQNSTALNFCNQTFQYVAVSKVSTLHIEAILFLVRVVTVLF